MLGVGFAVLTVAQFAISLGPDYPVFFVLRTIGDDAAGHLHRVDDLQPSRRRPGNTRRNITIYIAATIAGGYSGRVFSGLLTDLFDWQAAFRSGLRRIAGHLADHPPGIRPEVALWPTTTRRDPQPGAPPGLRRGTGQRLPLLFFVFAAMLNFLPFHA